MVDASLGARIRNPVHEYRVTKYNPTFRNQSGAYTKAEWTIFGQIGQTFSGVVLTSDEYERVEAAYIQSALSFLRESGLLSMRIAGLENSRKQPLDFQNGSVMPLDRIGEVTQQILREEFWCRLEGNEGFLHFGWTITCISACPILVLSHKQRQPRSACMLRNFQRPTLKMKSDDQCAQSERPGAAQGHFRNTTQHCGRYSGTPCFGLKMAYRIAIVSFY
ncbi:MAG: hypothetical protein ABSG16_22160 [Candidatus Acidiferrum sp.]|jgi:hypothetical protein